MFEEEVYEECLEEVDELFESVLGLKSPMAIAMLTSPIGTLINQYKTRTKVKKMLASAKTKEERKQLQSKLSKMAAEEIDIYTDIKKKESQLEKSGKLDSMTPEQKQKAKKQAEKIKNELAKAKSDLKSAESKYKDSSKKIFSTHHNNIDYTTGGRFGKIRDTYKSKQTLKRMGKGISQFKNRPDMDDEV